MTEEAKRLDLGGPFEGHYVLVDEDQLTMGFLEDMQAGNSVNLLLDGLASAIVGGNLPRGIDRAGLRRLRPKHFQYLLEAVTGVIDLPKAS